MTLVHESNFMFPPSLYLPSSHHVAVPQAGVGSVHNLGYYFTLHFGFGLFPEPTMELGVLFSNTLPLRNCAAESLQTVAGFF